MASSTSVYHPDFASAGRQPESDYTKKLIAHLNMQKHPEGGYFAETDRDPLRIPNSLSPGDPSDSTRSASTTIFYLLTPETSFGAFHRNKARTMHTLHKGRGRYVIIHADQAVDGKAPVETFVVGQDVLNGERLQWMVEGDKYKASFLLKDDASESSNGLLISEVVVPGFEFTDHDFLTKSKAKELQVPDDLDWLVRES